MTGPHPCEGPCTWVSNQADSCTLALSAFKSPPPAAAAQVAACEVAGNRQLVKVALTARGLVEALAAMLALLGVHKQFLATTLCPPLCPRWRRRRLSEAHTAQWFLPPAGAAQAEIYEDVVVA
jgi:hypothetical protein